MILLPLFDVLLIAALLLVSWRLLQASDLFQATVLFISFGLFLALTWIRLQAPDIALAEAAVGAGLAGVLLFGTFKSIEPDSDAYQTRSQDFDRDRDEPRKQHGAPSSSEPCRLDPLVSCPGRSHYLFAAISVGLLTLILILTVLDLPRSPGGLTASVARAMHASGVEHPVTAVLLNFRLYDTWLELGVLIMALAAVLAVRGRHDLPMPLPPRFSSPVLRWLVNILAPVALLVCVQLLWLGDHAPGGAFQSGVVLAAGLVLLWLSGSASLTALSRMALLCCIVAGFGAVLLMAAWTTLGAQLNPLEYPPAWAGTLILALEACATISIGVTLASLVLLALGPESRGVENRPHGRKAGQRGSARGETR